jgi:enoyl-CoA hydratase/carnithine racemase
MQYWLQEIEAADGGTARFAMNESPIADVLVEMRGTVCWITINRPAARNALNADVPVAIRMPCVA